jgi:acetoin utilization deacetylase AcuC-like enzyme
MSWDTVIAIRMATSSRNPSEAAPTASDRWLPRPSGCADEGGVLAYWHDDVLQHDAGSGLGEFGPSPLLAAPEPHPEGAARLLNMRSVLERGPLGSRIKWTPGRRATQQELLLFHTPEHVQRIADLRHVRETTRVTQGTFASPGTWRAIMAAAGSAVAAADAVIDGDTEVALALVRPPGHHATPNRVDGYCFVNNVALAAARSLDRGLERVAIIDWDAHHGNGAQTGFYDREEVLTVSIHQDEGSWGPHHPEPGSATEVGRGRAAGLSVNIALPFGAGNRAYIDAFEHVVRPVVRAFEPELLLCAAGQDASAVDPNGRMCVTMDGFHAIGAAIRLLADELTNGRVVLSQEGGYAVAYSGYCLYATLAGVLREALALPDPCSSTPDTATGHLEAIELTRRAVGSRFELS